MMSYGLYNRNIEIGKLLEEGSYSFIINKNR
jgi:hypothetical protein